MCGIPGQKNPWCPGKCPRKMRIFQSMWDVHSWLISDVYPPKYFCRYCRCSGNSTFFLGHLPEHQGCFFRVFHTSLTHILHFYLCVACLFRTFTHQMTCVHPSDAPKIPCFSWDIYPDTRVVFIGFSTHLWDMYCLLPVSDIFIPDIYPPNYLCTSCQCSRNFAFSQDIYLDTGIVFLRFSTFFPGHLPGHQACSSLVFNISPRTFTWTPELFSLRFFTHPQDMYCSFTCVYPIYLGHLLSKVTYSATLSTRPCQYLSLGSKLYTIFYVWTWGL